MYHYKFYFLDGSIKSVIAEEIYLVTNDSSPRYILTDIYGVMFTVLVRQLKYVTEAKEVAKTKDLHLGDKKVS